MIDGIDDFMGLKDQEDYRLVLKDNDLDKAIYEMKRAGYEPQVRHTAGRAVETKFHLTHKIGKEQKMVTYSIVTQHLDHDRINDDILVETEKYNKVSTTMFKDLRLDAFICFSLQSAAFFLFSIQTARLLVLAPPSNSLLPGLCCWWRANV